MSYRTIEASREIRLWIGQVIVPAIGVGVIVATSPGVRKFIEEKKGEVKNKFKK